MYGPGGFIRRKYWYKPVFYQTRANVFSRGNSNPDIISKFPNLCKYNFRNLLENKLRQMSNIIL
jgi:hypothetical protein